MVKNIWILHHYGTPPSLTGLTRPYHLAKNLLRAGYKCTVFAASYQHYAGYDLIDGKQRYIERNDDGVPFVYVRTPGYQGSGLARVRNMITFFLGILRHEKEFARRHGEPGVILASSPHLLTCIAGLRLAKRYGCKCIVEVRDLWPESILAYGNAKRGNPLVRALYQLEKWIYTKADAIIFTMEGGADYIREKGWDTEHGGPVDLSKVHHINNGVDLEVFDYNKEHYKIEDADLNDPNTFKVVYTGSVRKANGLGHIVDAARLLRDEKSIRILIYGDGDERQLLEDEAAGEGLENILFKGRVGKEYIPYILSKSDLCLLHWKSTPIIHYGMSMNKFFEYAASGKPILSSHKPGYDLIEEYHCGISKDIACASEFAAAIKQFMALSADEYRALCDRTNRLAADYDFKVLADELIRLINACLEERQ